MKIVKLEDSKIIELRTNGGLVFESFSSCISHSEVKCLDTTVQIIIDSKYVNILAEDVISTQVEPNAEVLFSGDANDLLSLLNSDFFDSCCDGSGGGGSGLLTAANGLYTAGSEVRLGTNPLIEDTTITESSYIYTHTKTVDPSGNGDVTVRYESAITDHIGLGGDALIKRLFVTDINSGNGEIGVGSDADNNPFFYAKSDTGGVETIMQGNSNSFDLRTRSFGVDQGVFSLNGSALTLAYLTKTENVGTTAILETYEIDYTTTGTATETVLNIPLAADETIQVLVKINYRRDSTNGSGWIDGAGGGYRDSTGLAQLTSNNMIVRIQDNIIRQNPLLNHNTSLNNYQIEIQTRRPENTRYIGIITILKTQF